MRDQVDWQTGWAPEKLEQPAKAINTSDAVRPRKSQLLKWVGTKQRYAREIVSYFPKAFRTYQEPFLGAGGVLGVLAPARARAVDTFSPGIDIWSALRDQPDVLVGWNRTHWEAEEAGGRTAAYETARARFNTRRDPADLIYFSRAANGGVIRFRPDGHMSTPPGQHRPTRPDKFAARVPVWHSRARGTRFGVRDYTESFALARAGDVVYCDPRYSYSQSILYRAQGVDLDDLFRGSNAPSAAAPSWRSASSTPKKRAG